MAATRDIDGFDGEVVAPDDAGYDEARAIWNAMHDKRPALVAYCHSTADVAAAVRHARAEGLAIAVRSGGHSLPGHSTCDGGIVIDLRGLNSIEVDPVGRRARVGGGALLGELDAVTQEHGLVVPAGVVSHTGVAGLTLGGGVGRQMRRLGLTIDSLLGVELVTATGEVVRVDAATNRDLFWAMRGGGGNFGIVTEFEFRAHEMGDLMVLATFNPIEEAARVLALAADVPVMAPDELLWTSFLRRAQPQPWLPPEWEGTLGVVSLIEWSGDLEEGRRVLGELAEQVAAPVSELAQVPFLALQTAGDELFGPGKRSYVKAGYLDDLSPAAIATLIEVASEVGSPFSQVEVLAVGGAIARVDADATAFPHRDAAWLVNIPASWVDASEDEREMNWARNVYRAIEPLMTGGAYVNFMGDDEVDHEAIAYGPTLERLRRVKAEWDPENVFRLNQNIVPASAEEVA
ncbi:MAG: FAD-binding oxidoreductase [Verrucomicrobia bacterium]|nr:FAD-binding oxidoreductase [Verrucomicrobiota bacterium]